LSAKKNPDKKSKERKKTGKEEKKTKVNSE